MRCKAVVLLIILACPLLHAVQLERRKLICPITGKSFSAEIIPPKTANRWRLGDPGPANMGTDEDGCRHDSGYSEYDNYVVISPWCYFAALSIEWSKNGRYRGRLPPGFKEWVRGPEINGEWITDRNRSYKRFKDRFGDNVNMPAVQDWEMPQEEIQLSTKYRMALRCYEKRDYPKIFLAKLALNGVWALRSRMCKPFAHPHLTGGIEEVNHELEGHLEHGEDFRRDKWAGIYKKIYEGGGLSPEGRFVAGFTHVGFLARQGDLAAMQKVLTDLFDQYRDEARHAALRSLIRNRINLVEQWYLPFMEIAYRDFAHALRREEVPRPRMPEVLLAMAELRRRMGDFRGALDWYLCLANMHETQPRLRKDLRVAGKVPKQLDEEPNLLLHLGWKADEMIRRLESKDGIENDGRPQGADRDLVLAVMDHGLGTLAYDSPDWEPMTGRDTKNVQLYLMETGKSVLDYYVKMEIFPDRLGDMWLDGTIQSWERNRMNRFHCPNTGAKFLYLRPTDKITQNTILVAMDKPLETTEGKRYGAFIYGCKVVWSNKPLFPGEEYRP